MIISIFLALALAGAAAENAEAPKPLSKDQAIERAETFIKEQGYTDRLGDPAKIVFEPLDSSRDKDSVLKTRSKTLESTAVGARLDSEIWFVGFRATGPGRRLRGVIVAQDGSLVKTVSQTIREDWLAGNDPPPRSVGQAEAGEIAAKFLKDAGAVAASNAPSKIEERQDADADPWNSWWVTFDKTTLKGKKGARRVIVAVHKETGEAKWVELKSPKAPAPPKAPPAKKTPKR